MELVLQNFFDKKYKEKNDSYIIENKLTNKEKKEAIKNIQVQSYRHVLDLL